MRQFRSLSSFGLVFLGFIIFEYAFAADTQLDLQENEAGFCQVDEGGLIENAHAGYTGSGYINTENASGEGISWSVSVPAASTYTLQWRYANGASARGAQLTVNGSNVGSLAFESTGGWTAYSQTSSLVVSLASGDNTIRLAASTNAGLANIDRLSVIGESPEAGSCGTGKPLAFPGAVGFGAEAEGGRGGDVYHVTNLNDSGSGSLREGLTSGHRTIVFDIGGTIMLESALNITHAYTTIAGQTAPGGGITVAGYPSNVNTNHVIIRYIRFRCGDFNALAANGLPAKGNGNLKANTAGAIDVGNSQHVILDHVSASWSMDETLSVTNSNNVTVQYSMITESLNNSYHEKGEHGYGSLIRAATSGEGYTFYRNLYAHHNGRNPGAGSNQTSGNYETLQLDFVNNVIYGWGNRSGEAIDGSKGGYVNLNYVGNYAISNSDSRNSLSLWDEDKTEGILTYQAGNKLDNNQNGVLDGSDFGWALFPNFVDSQKRSVRWAFPEIPTVSADLAYWDVLNNAGASRVRDAVDTRIINQVKRNSGSIIDSQDDNGGLPSISSASTPADTDQDGMIDSWEIAHGLDSGNGSDRNGYDLSAIYTNLEIYLHKLAQ